MFNQDLSVAALIRDKLHLDYSSQISLNGNSDGANFQVVQAHQGSELGVVSSTHNRVDEIVTGMSTPLDRPLGDPLEVVVQALDTSVSWFIPKKRNSTGGEGSVLYSTSGVVNVYDFPNTAQMGGVTTDLMGFYAEQNASAVVNAYFLTRNVNGVNLWLSSTAVPPLINTAPQLSLGNIPSFSPKEPGWMAVDANSGPVVYLSTPADSSGKYKTFVFDATGLIASWEGNDHVVAFLSTGRLLTKEGSFYNVCTAAGKILYSFPAGSLRFAGEYKNTFEMRARFAEALPYGKNAEDVRIRIYSLKTTKLDTLQ